MPTLPTPIEEMDRRLEDRYDNLRTVGRGMGFWGAGLKVVAFLLGIGGLVGSVMNESSLPVIGGVIGFVMAFGTGIIVCAAGELCGAAADTAKGTLLSSYLASGYDPTKAERDARVAQLAEQVDLPAPVQKSPLQQMGDLDRSRRGG